MPMHFAVTSGHRFAALCRALVMLFMLGVVLFAARSAHAQIVGAGPSQVTCYEPTRCDLRLNGPITAQLQREVEKLPVGALKHLTVFQSPGGDVAAALTIGRALRRGEAQARLYGDCASACVFLMAGAVFREADPGFGGRYGLHRPYAIAAAGSFESERQRVEKRNQALRAYLNEMNVQVSLLERMNTIASENILWISPKEAAQYGLGRIDPVWEEFRALKWAQQLGIDRIEFNRRKAEYNRRCEPLEKETLAFCTCLKDTGLRVPGATYTCDAADVLQRVPQVPR